MYKEAAYLFSVRVRFHLHAKLKYVIENLLSFHEKIDRSSMEVFLSNIFFSLCQKTSSLSELRSFDRLLRSLFLKWNTL